MVATQTTTTNEQTWLRALARARSEGIRLLRNRKTGEYMATSSDGRRLYKVTEDSCTCAAGEQGIPCKHRAAMLSHLGIINDRQPEPEHAPVPAARTELDPVTAEAMRGLSLDQIAELRADAARISQEIGFFMDWRTGEIDWTRPW